jgi:hypothetical protein
MSDKIYRVEIADATGYSVVEMTKSELTLTFLKHPKFA